MPNAIVLAPNQRKPALNVVGESVTVLATRANTGGLECFIQEGDADIGPPPHDHPWDEAFLVLSGRVSFTVEGKESIVEAGGFCFIPGGTVHAYRNLETSRLLSVTSGGDISELFRAADAEVQRIPDDLPKLLEIGARLNTTFHVGPPGA